jgi:hypothetical protein
MNKVIKNNHTLHFASCFYRNNNFDGIIFLFQLNISVVGEEIAAVAHDP